MDAQGAMRIAPAAASALNAMIADACVISMTCAGVKDRLVNDADVISSLACSSSRGGTLRSASNIWGRALCGSETLFLSANNDSTNARSCPARVRE